jgi:uroporphyrinogen-III synthase
MGVRVIVSRPGVQGEQLARKLTDAGVDIDARHGPTLAIKTLSLIPPVSHYDYMIFISPSAVEASVLQDPGFARHAETILAVGTGTGRTLHDAGIKKVLVPETFNSEGLLAMPELQQVKNLRILVVKGVGGRPVLRETLVQRGARVDSLDVYQRQPVQVAAETWRWFWAEPGKRVLTCASIETLEAFDKQRQADNLPADVTICVASDRIAEACRRLGYTSIINAGGAANDYFVTTLKQMTDV